MKQKTHHIDDSLAYFTPACIVAAVYKGNTNLSAPGGLVLAESPQFLCGRMTPLLWCKRKSPGEVSPAGLIELKYYDLPSEILILSAMSIASAEVINEKFY
ncbi:hypothetical protein AVEN_154892-1 [Araneus ventricosus]|uniref:Uncharacterized protein n=1 Tax=Araneus ventricosus TaxID=182803 RepID=A0A4Y2A6V4_ARAVE|nr:hypothetical protein AVEN_154892-1 [Araneus ventricosus]